MAKRIPCRVVRSVPLGKSSDALRYASRSNNKHYKTGDVAAVDAQVRHGSDSVIYTGQLDITRVSIDDGLTGQILDCYV